MSSNYIAKLLRELRLKHNYTQAYLGNLLGKNQTYYSRLEAGQSVLTIPEAKTLAETYKVSLSKFFDECDCADEVIIPSNSNKEFSDYLTECFKNEYFKLYRAYIKLCKDNDIDPEL
jgi:transcriptional regulator with XRE-family HTH domain